MKAYLEPSEVEQLEEAASCIRDKLLIRLLFRLGCRISEALVLKVEDVDFSQRMVTIQHLKSRLRLSCPHCQARLGKSHHFCPRCGVEVAGPVSRAQESKRRDSSDYEQEDCEWNIGWLSGYNWTEEPGKGTRICNLGATAMIEASASPPDCCQQPSEVVKMARSEFEF